MAKIAFILLCHKDPEGVARKVRMLTASGACVAIHYDARAPRAAFDRLRAALADEPEVVFARRRVKCGWGEWSLVQATLNTLQAAVAAFDDATHFYLISGDCMPIKTAEYMREFLDADDADHIESVDFFESGWIRTGLRAERLIYRHYFNERTRKGLFYASMEVQRRLGLARRLPADLEVMIGSQWWCLRRGTVEALLAFCRERRDIVRFFSTTWVPDETFFQSLVRHLVPDTELRSRTPTFLVFSDYGMPVTFHNDQYDLLVAQDHLFARKISPEAETLKRRLEDLHPRKGERFEVADTGRQVYSFLTGAGRVGQRFATRIWERQSTIGRDRELLMVVCKNWPAGRRVVAALGASAGVPTVDYLFDDPEAGLPDLGGIERSLAKRGRHRRAVLRMLFDRLETDRLAICLDPASFGVIEDLTNDRCAARILEVECGLSDDFLIGHARRIGVVGDAPSPEMLSRVLPTLRQDIRRESDRLREAGFAAHHRLRESAHPDENARAVAAFARVSHDAAHQVVTTDGLFSD